MQKEKKVQKFTKMYTKIYKEIDLLFKYWLEFVLLGIDTLLFLLYKNCAIHLKPSAYPILRTTLHM